VDDDPTDRELFSNLLSQAGFDVRQTASGDEATELARQYRPDLILLDVVMPGSSGFEVCQRIKSEPELRDVLVAFHSGLETNTEHRAGGLEKGADDYIVKTPNRREFLARIRTLLRLRDATALRAVEQHYQRLIDILPEAAALMDTQGRLIAANDHAVHLLGFADAIALVARNFFELIIPTEHERLRADMAITLDRGRASNTQYTILHSDGQAFPAETSAATIQGPRGQIIGLLVVIRDITERMRAAEALKSIEERFRQLAENIREVFWMKQCEK